MTVAIPETKTSSSWASRTSLYFWLAAFLLAGLFAARNLSTWSARIPYPGDEDYEGVALVLTNDLFGAALYADPLSRAALWHICAYVQNELPRACWGSNGRVEEWLNSPQAKKEREP